MDGGDEVEDDFERLSSEDFRNEVLQAIVIEAHFSKSKYRHVVASIRFWPPWRRSASPISPS